MAPTHHRIGFGLRDPAPPSRARGRQRLAVRELADATTPVTPALDARLHRLLATIEPATDASARASAADAAIGALLEERPLDAELELANDVLVELADRVRRRTGTTLAARFGVSDRAVQRALARTVGHGPNGSRAGCACRRSRGCSRRMPRRNSPTSPCGSATPTSRTSATTSAAWSG